ncbi:uncharacterized protein LOC108101772 [Drosophila ficusphila]|uniref:uncharacterized protein LOC108101772 n=1 Tax=Drosophila ficusphila TaxID=30025 RepID=UPI0007E5C9BA|nr:uncharacterized protein LOC108101772 [Drosophila ficusphila]XP_017061735.1 uncharacterized protein LOC108101772 [Drosophila ficusphila]
MFNFHKPRVYRSADGCCICRAKSSSSRFTASRKYEKESMQCFNLHEPRNGEICNACVLLVKRYKRLPIGSKRHWGHVVDARAGPGTKSLAKQKKRDNSESDGKNTNGSGNSFLPEKFAKIFKKNRKGKITATAGTKSAAPSVSRAINRPSSTSPTSENQPSDSNESNDDDQMSMESIGSSGGPYQTRKRTAAAALANNNDSAGVGKRVKLTGSNRRRQLPPQKNRRAVDDVPFFEENDLVRLEVCCGVVFQSLSLGNCCYIIDPELYKPCEKHQRLRRQQLQLQQQHLHEKQAEAAAISPPNTQLQSQGPKVGPLKKHHLFFKRQSELFPQGDIHSISPIPLSKTETTTTTSQPHSNLSLVLKPTGGGQSQPQPRTQVQAQAQVVAVGATSPSSLSNKFNDNSSDSGFDEHVLERKSVSPPHVELKVREIPGGMQLILATGLPLAGQPQNLVLAGNEFTARIVQQREAGGASAVTAVPLKINVLGGSQGNGNKMRAIFNSASSIQHENGVTTILPASSLAASNQTAAMNAIAPSTVTITPSSVSKKVAVANPKIIQVKPAKFVDLSAAATIEPPAPPPPEAKIA